MYETMDTPAVVTVAPSVVLFFAILFFVLVLLNRHLKQQLEAARKEIGYLKKQLTPPVINNVTIPQKSGYLVLMVILITVVVNVLVYVIASP